MTAQHIRGRGLTAEEISDLRDAVEDLSNELASRYSGYPENDRRRVRDVAVVTRARAILAEIEPNPEFPGPVDLDTLLAQVARAEEEAKDVFKDGCNHTIQAIEFMQGVTSMAITAQFRPKEPS